jgi:hypothetical protein
LDASLLEGVYIPNLVASPFVVNKAYAELIFNRTSSPHLSKVLRKWDEERWRLVLMTRFTEYENTFETIGEPDYAAELITDANVDALLSKD